MATPDRPRLAGWLRRPGSAGESELRQNVYSGVVVDGHLQGDGGLRISTAMAPTIPVNFTASLMRAATTCSRLRRCLQPRSLPMPDHAIDGDTGKPVGQGYRLNRARDGQYGLISPLMTMVRATLDNYPGMSVEQAEEAVRAMFGLTEGYDLHADYTLKTRPSTHHTVQMGQVHRRIRRAHNIGRLAALRFGQYVSQAPSPPHGGPCPGKGGRHPARALASRVAIEVAPLRQGRPNKGS